MKKFLKAFDQRGNLCISRRLEMFNITRQQLDISLKYIHTELHAGDFS